MAKSNIATVVSFEVVRTLRTRVFWIGALLGPILFAGIMAIAVASSASASDEGALGESFSFEWVDQSGLINVKLMEAVGGVHVTDAVQGIEDVRTGKVEAFFEFPADPANNPILVAAQDRGIVGSDQYSSVASELLRRSAGDELNNPMLVKLASGDIAVSLTTYKDGAISPGVWGIIPPLLYIGLFFIIVVMQGNRMLTATLEEKENRVTEMILTTIKPTALLTGKVIALGVIGLVQAVVIVIPSVVVAVWLVRAGLLKSLDLGKLVFEPAPMIIGALLLVGGFLVFTCSLVAIGAAMPTVKDAQGMYATVILLLIIPLYLIAWMITSPDNLLIRIFTYFPWTAPMTAMGRNAIGNLPWWQGLLVSAILFATAYVVFRIASRLFQYGSVEYSKRTDFKAAVRMKRK